MKKIILLLCITSGVLMACEPRVKDNNENHIKINSDPAGAGSDTINNQLVNPAKDSNNRQHADSIR